VEGSGEGGEGSESVRCGGGGAGGTQRLFFPGRNCGKADPRIP